jgi:predicted PurR-regulated permease PerM
VVTTGEPTPSATGATAAATRDGQTDGHTRGHERRPPAGQDGSVTPAWLRAASDWTWRSFVIAFGVVALVYALGFLRVVVLPIIIALLLTTLLLPLARAFRKRGAPDALAAAMAMICMVLVLGGVATAVAPSIGNQASDLGQGVKDGARQATDVLAHKPFNLSRRELDQRVNDLIKKAQDSSGGGITTGLHTGAVIAGELFTGFIITLLLTFFFLKDGRQMWDWLVGLFASRHREGADELGSRVFAALSGYVRGIALVGLVDALLIGLALLVIGVPLVVPLMILTFLGAFMPLIGAFLAGLAAVLIALVSNGLLAAALVLGAIILVQQVEGHLLYPVLMSRTVHLHPAVIVLSLAFGGVVAGIIGVFLAVPAAGVVSTVLDFVRNRPQPDPPLAEPEAQAVPG